MTKFPKFIILDEVLILSKVEYHKDILLDKVDPVKEKARVKGGGWFVFKPETNTYIFGGESHDFGAAKLEDIQKAVDEGNVFTNIQLMYSIAGKHNFAYNTGSEIVLLKTFEDKE